LSDVLLYIDGSWKPARSGRFEPYIDPATEKPIGRRAHADVEDLDEALAAAQRGFLVWRKTPANERYKVLRRAADLVRERAEDIVRLLTAEQGKPLAEARIETLACADNIDWTAEEGRRIYGRVIPARSDGVRQIASRDPVGPVAAFTPWNFPLNQAVRKIAPSLATGCSIIIKGPEETPASVAALVQAFADAGVPAGVLNLVFGDPAAISAKLIASPIIRKISFTGSTAVGKELAALAGRHMKRTTMELGGHAPVLVFADADISRAARMLAGAKFRNAGQICASPTRFLVEDSVYEPFVEAFAAHAAAIKVGPGHEDSVGMGPLANGRRLAAIEDLVGDAVKAGATVRTGGQRVGNQGFFYAPTVLTGVPVSARMMNEEPFGPIAPIASFSNAEEAIAEANRLDFGLAAYAFTRSARTAAELGERVESGMLTINHMGLALPETPFGGIKDSGHGSEGGAETLDAYLTTRFVTELVQ
jgi:succinate-semialdehyde dehydrogenase/glutarate-semialdehyde dehydrogenase